MKRMKLSSSSTSLHGDKSNPSSWATAAEDADWRALRLRRMGRVASEEKDTKEIVEEMVKDDPSLSYSLSEGSGNAKKSGDLPLWKQMFRDFRGKQDTWSRFIKSSTKSKESLREALGKMVNNSDGIDGGQYRNQLNGQNILHYLLDQRDKESVMVVFDACVNSEFYLQRFDVEVSRIKGKKNALHQLVDLGDVELVDGFHMKISSSAALSKLLYDEMPVEVEGQRSRSLACCHLAACRGHDRVLEYLIRRMGVSVDQTNSRKDTALMWAARWGRESTVRLLLALKANVDAANDRGSTALYWAVRYGHDSVVRVLVTVGHADVNKGRKVGLQSPLILAAALGVNAIFKTLLVAGADPNVKSAGGSTALHHAAREGHADIITELIAAGASIDVTDKHGDTPLLLAAKHSHTRALQILIVYGANMGRCNLRGEDVWHLAVTNTSPNILKILLMVQRRLELSAYPRPRCSSSGAITDSTDARTSHHPAHVPLLLAASLGRTDKLQQLLDLDVDAGAMDESGNTFLHVAAVNDCSKVIQLFTTKIGTDVLNKEGNTPLHCACDKGHDSSVLALLEQRATADIANDKGQTCLHLAARASNISASTVNTLLEYVINSHTWTNVNLQDFSGNTPLHMAAMFAKPDVLREFRALRIDDAANEDGNSALHLAVRAGDGEEVLNVMLDMYEGNHYITDINKQNCLGQTVVMLAARQGLVKSVDRLIQLGADVSLQDKQGNSTLHHLTSLTISDHAHHTKYMAVYHVTLARAVQWWCSRKHLKRPSETSEQHQQFRREAVLYLTRKVINSEKLCVLKHACTLGAVPVISLLANMDEVTSYTTSLATQFDVTGYIPLTISGNSKTNSNKGGKPTKTSCLELILRHRSKVNVVAMLDVQMAVQVFEKFENGWTEDLGSLNGDGGEEPFRDLGKLYSSLTSSLYAVLMVLHLLYSGLFTWSALELQGRDTPGNFSLENAPVVVLYVVVPLEPVLLLIYSLYFFAVGCCGLRKCCQGTQPHQRRRSVLGAGVRVTFRLAYSLLVMAAITSIYIKYEYKDYVISAALLSAWLFSITFTRAIQPIHFYWRMIKQMFMQDIIRFLVLYLIILLAFTFAFYAHFVQSESVSEIYPNPFYAMYYVFNLMLGMGEIMEDGVQEGMAEAGRGVLYIQILYALYMVTAHIILLNLLVAMLNDSYTAVREMHEILWRVEAVQMGVALADSIPFIKPLIGRSRLSTRTLHAEDLGPKTKSKKRWLFSVAAEDVEPAPDSLTREHQEDTAEVMLNTLNDVETRVTEQLAAMERTVAALKASINVKH